MDIDPYNLLGGFIFGVIGLWMLKEGKRNTNFKVIFIGLALMVVPYFIPTAKMLFLVCGALCFLAYKVWWD
jgi:hypothetical protein